MPSKFYDYMVDIETTGLDPDHAAIIQIAAVRFDLKSRSLDTENMFDMCLSIPQGRYWDEDTRNWWMGKNRGVYQTLVPRMQEPGPVVHAFCDWVNLHNDQAEPIRFWSKPSHFDFPFIDSYCKQFGRMIQFHFRHAIDVNSFIRGLACDTNANLNYSEFQGDAHNALIDVINQIGNVFAAVDHHKPVEAA